MYFAGCPAFAPEKPILTPYFPQTFVGSQKSGEWYGELKLKSKRGVIAINQDGVAGFYQYNSQNITKIRGDVLKRIENNNLPPKTIFDCCLLEQNNPKLWIFDCLMFAGEQLTNIAMIKRRRLVTDNLTHDDLVWIPIMSHFWLRELDLIKDQKSALVKETALKCGIPYREFKHLVTGMVIKNKNSYLSFPEKTKFVASSMFKINL